MGYGLSPMPPTAKPLPAAGVDRYVRIWDIETGRLLRSLRGHTADIRALVFTPDGRALASGSEDRTIRLWNPKTGEPTKLLFTRYDHNVCSFSLSPDGLMLARGSHNKDIKIWEVTTGTDLMTLLGKDQYDHHWSVCVAFSPDGMHLASGSDIGKIRIWEVLPSGEEKILHNGHWEEISRGLDGDPRVLHRRRWWIPETHGVLDRRDGLHAGRKNLDHRKPGQYDPLL